jgi:RNA polymerase sigma factor (sigma-70 family)
MNNPFSKEYAEDKTDLNLIESALKGDKDALEELITRHQDWIYNIALHMVFYSDEAKDITQEVLIKIITNLSSFKGKSQFRTWVYRIVVNHVLNMKKSKGEKMHSTNFKQYGETIDKTPDIELQVNKDDDFDMNLVVEEVKFSCIFGMLMCLDREQRIIFILGALFGIPDYAGSEIMQITKSNFRKKLSRARYDLFNFMNNKCGLINKSNPCHCTNKTRALINSGYINPKKLLFNTNYIYRIKQVAGRKVEIFTDYFERKGSELLLDLPFQKSPDFVEYIRKLINNDEFKEIFNFN